MQFTAPLASIRVPFLADWAFFELPKNVAIFRIFLHLWYNIILGPRYKTKGFDSKGNIIILVYILTFTVSNTFQVTWICSLLAWICLLFATEWRNLLIIYVGPQSLSSCQLCDNTV